MKILLAVDHKSDPRIVSAYLAERFGKQGVEVDVVTVLEPEEARNGHMEAGRGSVVYHPRLSGADYKNAVVRLNAIAQELRERQGLETVRTHVLHGDPAEALLQASREWRSALLLAEAPRRKRLVAGLDRSSVVKRLLASATCPVELLRPYAASPRSEFNVLVPIALEQLGTFPFAELRSLRWAAGCRLHLLCVQPAAIDEALAEVSPAVLLESMMETRRMRARAHAALTDICAKLPGMLGSDIEVDFDVVEGNLQTAIVDGARRAYASLIVLSSPVPVGLMPNLMKKLSPAALAISAPCSVLLLQPGGKRGDDSQRVRQSAPVVSLFQTRPQEY